MYTVIINYRFSKALLLHPDNVLCKPCILDAYQVPSAFFLQFSVKISLYALEFSCLDQRFRDLFFKISTTFGLTVLLNGPNYNTKLQLYTQARLVYIEIFCGTHHDYTQN